MIICKYVCGPLSLQVTIWTLAEASGHTHMLSPPKRRLAVFKFFFFFSGMSAPEKVKKYSLHWTYIDLSSQKPLPSLAFDRNPSKSGQGPKLKLLDPSSYQALWHHFKMWRVHFRCSQNKLKIYSTEHVSDWLNINISKSAVRKMTIWSLRVF